MVKAKEQETQIEIQEPDIQVLHVRIVGTAPLMQQAFWKKMEMQEKMERGESTKRDKNKPRDYAQECADSCHVSTEGWIGIPASAFRSALIAACRLCNLAMSKAKLAVHVQADGVDRRERLPLVRLDAGDYQQTVMATRNSGGGKPDMRARPLWEEWAVNLRIEFDASFITLRSVLNLLVRAGRQVGVGEGRPNSKDPGGGGLGLGTFAIDRDSVEVCSGNV